MFEEGTAAGVLPAQGTRVPDPAEQGRLQGALEPDLGDVAVGER